MGSCCNADDYSRMFTPKEARRDLNRYLKSGLRGSELDLAEALSQVPGFAGSSVLEIGAGLGALHIDLLERGAAAATAVDISSSWSETATRLAEQKGFADRVSRLEGDIVDIDDTTSGFDVVVAHRVICCYPAWEPFLDAATARARVSIGLTFPRDAVSIRMAIRLGNLFPRLSGLDFRAYVHDPVRMLAHLAARGFLVTHDRSGRIWRTVVAVR